MSRKDYNRFADIFGVAFASTNEEGWKLIYDAVYTPFVAFLEEENESFDTLRFSEAVARKATETLVA